tara:strand:+ start:564 stop:818 length:255 start_codon:yes stop_codon:yes gene_type:complete
MSAPYRIDLTAEDMLTIGFVGARYAWSEVLIDLGEGEHELGEAEAWRIAEACNADTEGGHAVFPMLAPESELFAKLLAFRDGII